MKKLIAILALSAGLAHAQYVANWGVVSIDVDGNIVASGDVTADGTAISALAASLAAANPVLVGVEQEEASKAVYTFSVGGQNLVRVWVSDGDFEPLTTNHEVTLEEGTLVQQVTQHADYIVVANDSGVVAIEVERTGGADPLARTVHVAVGGRIASSEFDIAVTPD